MPPIGNPIKKAAESYINRGWPVVPSNGKQPTPGEWQNKRLTLDDLDETYGAGSKLNVNIVLNAADFMDVECDDDEAEENLQDLFGGEIPPTPTWSSNRGQHRLFLRPEGLPKKSVIKLAGIEFRGTNPDSGACSVLPPSIHPVSGKRYKWLPGLSPDDVPIAELPESIVAKLRDPKPKSQPTASDDKQAISDGDRNNTLYSLGLNLRRLGFDEDGIAQGLLTTNAQRCQPPLEESEVRDIAKSAATGDPKVGSGLLDSLVRDLELWHDENDDPFATVPQGEHRENWRIGKRTKKFRQWVRKRCWDLYKEPMKDSDLNDILGLLEGMATFDGEGHLLCRRTGEHNDKNYLDLVNDPWEAVEIDAEGWRVVSNPPVKFIRAGGMNSLPTPVPTDPAELKGLLFPFLNIIDSQWILTAAWLTAAMRPKGPYPILKLFGEQGSAKTTTARVCRSVIDPNSAPVRAEPRSTRDLMISANNSHVQCFDNLSSIKTDLSDALCRLATGGGFATRQLYSDAEEAIFDAQRPVILTSIEEIGVRSDLLERSLLIDLPTIREQDRRAEKQFWKDFEQVQPKILGSLLSVVSGAMRELPTVEASDLPRLADFFIWGVACERALGLESGTFAEAFAANQENALHVVLEGSPLITTLMKYLEKYRPTEGKPYFEKTAQEWLNKLRHQDGAVAQQPGWPKTPAVLSSILKRAAPNLRHIGIIARQATTGRGNDHKKVWQIYKPKQAEKPSGVATGRRGSTFTKKISSKRQKER